MEIGLKARGCDFTHIIILFMGIDLLFNMIFYGVIDLL